MENEKNYVTVKGTAKIYTNNDIDFRAQQSGKPSKEQVCTTRNSEVYKTTGKSPKTCALIRIPPDSPDPAGAMIDEVMSLCKKAWPDGNTPRAVLKKGRVLKKDEGLDIRLENSKLNITLDIDLKSYPDYKERMYKLINDISICLAYNKDLVSQRLRALAKDSTK